MKKFVALVILLFLGGAFLAQEAEAQRRKGRYKPKINRQIDRYKGSRNAMSNYHKYKVLGFSINAFNASSSEKFPKFDRTPNIIFCGFSEQRYSSSK